MMVWVTSSVMIPMTVANVKVPSIHSTFMRCAVSGLTSPITVTPVQARVVGLYMREVALLHFQSTRQLVMQHMSLESLQRLHVLAPSPFICKPLVPVLKRGMLCA